MSDKEEELFVDYCRNILQDTRLIQGKTIVYKCYPGCGFIKNRNDSSAALKHIKGCKIAKMRQRYKLHVDLAKSTENMNESEKDKTITLLKDELRAKEEIIKKKDKQITQLMYLEDGPLILYEPWNLTDENWCRTTVEEYISENTVGQEGSKELPLLVRINSKAKLISGHFLYDCVFLHPFTKEEIEVKLASAVLIQSNHEAYITMMREFNKG